MEDNRDTKQATVEPLGDVPDGDVPRPRGSHSPSNLSLSLSQNLETAGSTGDSTEVGPAGVDDTVDPSAISPQPDDHPGAAASSSSFSFGSPGQTTSGSRERQLTRNALRTAHTSAQNVSRSLKSSSRVFRLGIETMEKLVSPVQDYTWSKLQTYGDPLLSHFDQKLDQAIDAVKGHTNTVPDGSPASAASPPNEADERAYGNYWDHLKGKFAQSQWFARVDSILSQNKLVQSVNTTYLRPAEMFFNTATEVYMEESSDDYNTFLLGMQGRMGPAWDSRLAAPCKAFFHTAQTCKAVVGTGRFFGGVIQLGKQRLNNAIDELLEQWDRVLGLGDDVVDSILPELSESASPAAANLRASSTGAQSTDMDDSDFYSEDEDEGDGDGDNSVQPDITDGAAAPDEESLAVPRSTSPKRQRSDSGLGSDDEAREAEVLIFDMEMDGAKGKSDRADADVDADADADASGDSKEMDESSPWKRRRAMSSSLAQKVSHRIRQRVPLARELPVQLKDKLLQSTWFTTVDSILSQNVMVQLMLSQMSMMQSRVLRPAEHFYNTAADTFKDNYSTCEQFVSSVRQRMGVAWDDRLHQFAVSFFNSASSQKSGPLMSPDEPADLDGDSAAASAAAANASASK